MVVVFPRVGCCHTTRRLALTLTLKRLVVCLLPTPSLLRGRGSRTTDFLVNVVGTTAYYLYSFISMAGCILSLNGIAEARIQPMTLQR
ncbi:hypothetical protein DYB30_009322 [Aphanomyces astaci]|uniref:Uncharacterized protein n=1 Tax=Aphanomyces astaci TaxID=112090 RepID=A0A397ED28_APHAT|nr:hypothetical protein DYB38_008096 [Aphanomyces astaci]RHY71406.1 hypothetical protein DYB30_009322 [Aphanomyces astaci]RHY80860.1 hypothetical protein DYB31_008044 [Aphanomyces astaci]